MRTLMILWMIAAGCGMISVYADDGSVALQHQSSFSRLRVSIDSTFKPVVKDSPKGFEIHIPSAVLMDIGVPFGGENEFNRNMSRIQDERIQKIEVREKESGVVISGKYRFPSGKDALANEVMEHFDFSQKEQGKFVVDFWYKKGPTRAEAEREKVRQEAKKATAKRDEVIRENEEKRLRRERKIEESRRALKFCEFPMSRENTLWVKFRAEHPVINLNQYFSEFIPDQKFDYRVPTGKSEEEQMVRLAHKLTAENKYGLVIKTIEFLEKKHPKSKFLTEMEFLKASTYYRLKLPEEGKEMIRDLARKGGEVGLMSAAFLAVQAFQKAEWLSALNSFMNIRKEAPNHELNWVFRYGSAESLYQIRQYDQARLEYEWLAKNAPRADVRSEAAFKLGDLFFSHNQYAQAIQAYDREIRKRKDMVTKFPQVLMNQAESFFQLEEYQRAAEVFKKYLDVAKTHPSAWKASLRLAEIRSIEDPRTLEKNFTETVNQYPMTAGAVVARLRMLPCSGHGGFDLPGAVRYIASDEVKHVNDPDSFYSSSLVELIGLTNVRTLLSFEEDEKAVQTGLAVLRENPTVEARRMIEVGLVGGVKRLLERQYAQKNYYSMISIYEKYGDYLPPPTFDPICDEMRLKIAKFAAEKKLTSLALKIVEPYRSGDEAELRSAANEIQKALLLDSSNDQEERALVEAKSLWNGGKFDSKDEKLVSGFLDRLASIQDQSKLALERDLLRSLYYRSADNGEKSFEAGKRLTQKLRLQKHYVQAQIWSYLGEIAKENKDASYSANAFHRARQIAAKLSDKDAPSFDYRQFPTVPSVSYLYISEGEQLERQEKWKEAVALYGEAIENKIGGNHVLYAHARLLLRDGGRESKLTASRSLEKIKQSQEDDVWKNLAQKALDGIAKEGKDEEKRK